MNLSEILRKRLVEALITVRKVLMHSRSHNGSTALPSQPHAVSRHVQIRPDGAVKPRRVEAANPWQTVSPDAHKRVLRMKHVLIKLGVSRSAIYDWLNPHSRRFDASFPKPFKINRISQGAIGWHEAAVDTWIASRSIQDE